MFETQVKLTFVLPTGEVERVKRITQAAIGKYQLSPVQMGAYKQLEEAYKTKKMHENYSKMQQALTPSIMSKVGGMISPGIGEAMGAMTPALGAAAAVGALVVSSPSLQGTLKALTNTVMLLIRPVGDILAVGLRPIIDILRPIGLFFRILIKPYLDAAKKSMQLGRQFAAKGPDYYGQAAEAYALGAGFLLKPFFDMMVTVSTIGVQGVLAGLKLLGSALIAIVPFTEDVNVAFQEMMDGAILNVGFGGASIITETSTMMYDWLIELEKGYALIKDQANVSMGITAGYAGEGFVRIIQAATHFLVTTESVEILIDSMFDNIVEYGRTKTAELQAILHPGTTTTTTAWGGGSTSGAGATGSWGGGVSSNLPSPGTYIPIMPGTAPISAFKDFIWRPGSKPVQISPEDTIVGTKGGASKSVSVGDINIRIDKVASDVDVRRLAGMVRDDVINSLRMMS